MVCRLNKALPLLLVLMLLARVAGAVVATCTITGKVVNADGSADANDTITINPYPTTQIINNTTVTAQPKSVQTDASGNVTAFALIQNLNVYVTFHNSTAAAIATFVPNSTTASFAQFLAGTLVNSIPTANGGLNVTGSLVVNQIGTPTAPTVTVNVTGSTSYTYFCVAEDFNLNDTIPSAGTTVTTGAASPNNIVTCGGQTGALNYIVLKTNTSTKLGTCVTLSGTSCAVTDVGQSTSAYVANTVDATGSLYFSNNSPIFEKDSGGTYRNLFHLDTSNILQIGGTGIASINFANATNISTSFTHLTITGASGQKSLNVTAGDAAQPTELITEIAGQTSPALEVDDSTAAKKFEIDPSGGIALFGSTSGVTAIVTPAIAGLGTLTLPTVNLKLPTTLGTTGYVMTNTDGAGTAAWQAPNTGISLYFGGNWLVNTAASSGYMGVMRTTRALTVDQCYGAWPAMGGCTVFPQLNIVDITGSTTICSASSDNTGSTGTSETVTTSAIPSGHTVEITTGTQVTVCTPTSQTMSIGMTYH